MMKKYFLVVCAVFMFVFVAGVLYGADEETVWVVSYEGDVKVIPPGEKEAIQPKPGMLLEEGTKVITGKASFLDVTFDKAGNNSVQIKDSSEVVIKLDGSDKIELVDGEVYVLINKLEKGEEFRVKTPCATCGARGTGWNTTTDGETADVAVLDGKVFMRGINRDGSPSDNVYWIDKGYQRSIKKFRVPGEKKKISADRMSKMRGEADAISGRMKVRVREINLIDRGSLELRKLDRATIEKREDLLRRTDTTRDKRDRVMDRQNKAERWNGLIRRKENVQERTIDQTKERKDEWRLRQKRREGTMSSGTGGGGG